MRWLTPRAQGALHIAPCPPLLKPAHMTEFPQWRIHGGELRDFKMGGFERLLVLAKQVQRMIARVNQCQRQWPHTGLSHQGRINQPGAGQAGGRARQTG